MRKIIISAQFHKKLVKFLSKNSELKIQIRKTFNILEKDINNPLLKTHKLHGQLSVFYACYITYQYRLVFSYDKKYIYPHTVGSHDEVY